MSKRTFAVVLAILMVLLAALMLSTKNAFADSTTNPVNSFAQVHCHAANQANDWPGVSAYCKAAAEEWLVAAQANTGLARTYDLMNGAITMVLSGIGSKAIGDTGAATGAFESARRLYNEASASTTDQNTLSKIQRGREQLIEAIDMATPQ